MEEQTTKNNLWMRKVEEIRSQYPEFYVCEKCGGIGAYLVTHDYKTYYKFCYICQGEGKISWIQNAFQGNNNG